MRHIELKTRKQKIEAGTRRQALKAGTRTQHIEAGTRVQSLQVGQRKQHISLTVEGPARSAIPSIMSEAVLWMDVSDISLVFQDDLGTAPVASIGDLVRAIRHPETGDIVMVVPPTRTPPKWGGADVGIVFENSSNVRIFSVGSFDIQSGLFVCAQITRQSGGYLNEHPIDLFRGDAGSPTGRSVARTALGDVFFRRGQGGTPSPQPLIGVPEIGVPTQLSWGMDAVRVFTRKDGAENNSVAWASGGLGDGFRLSLGGEPFSTSSSYAGSIKGIGIWNRSLSPSEIEEIESHLTPVEAA